MYELIYPNYENFDKYKNLKYNVKYRIKKSVFKKHIGKQCEFILHVPDTDSVEKIKMYIYDVYNNYFETPHLHQNDDIYSFKNEKDLFLLLESEDLILELDKEYAQEKINEVKKLYEME